MLTISEVARMAGVTVRAVRHYHERGLLPEPERDHSGYRRYVPDDVVALIRIKTLAEAGVPLARVGELLAADKDEFADAVAEIDVRLQADVRQLQQRRARVAALVGGDGLALPEEVVAYLTQMRELGLSERMIELERDGWILISAHAPEHVPQWIASKRDALSYPGYLEFYQAFDEAHDWHPDDPRLVRLADEMAAAFATLDEDEQAQLHQNDEDQVFDKQVAAVLDEHSLGSSPAWRRLAELLDERGMPWVARIDRED
ncbi:MerR family transcriptional regulator [Nocardioides sp.]|uniref:MerR family transcriptional regulator n=1 Tax=Nocardioides sp. TaxID=35761 RepID=UPI002ED5DF8B